MAYMRWDGIKKNYILKRFDEYFDEVCECKGIYIDSVINHDDTLLYKLMCPIDGKKVYLDRGISLMDITAIGLEKLAWITANDAMKEFKGACF